MILYFKQKTFLSMFYYLTIQTDQLNKQNIIFNFNSMKKIFFSIVLLVLLAIPVENQLCNTFDPEIAQYASRYAGCSNVNTQFMDRIQNWSYSFCKEAQIPQQVTEINVFTNQELYLLAFMAYDKERNLIVLSFRGSVCGDHWKNAQTDFEYAQVPYQHDLIPGGCSSYRCWIHYGFINSYNKLKTDIRAAVLKSIGLHNPQTRILVTGISYGAAMAAIASYDLKIWMNTLKIKNKLISYTFGQPRLGNQKLIDEINKNIEIFRLVNKADPVPHLPPRCKDRLRYFNPGHEIFIKNSSSDSQLEIVTCEGDGIGCSLNAFNNKFLVSQHVAYPFIYYSVKSCIGNDIVSRSPDFIDPQSCNKERIFLEEWIYHTVCQKKPEPIPYPPQLKCQTKDHPIRDFLKSIFCKRLQADIDRKIKNENKKLENDAELQENSLQDQKNTEKEEL